MSLNVFCIVLLSALIQASWNIYAKHHCQNRSIAWIGMGGFALLSLPIAIWLSGSTSQFFTNFLLSIPSGLIHALYLFMLLRGYAKWDISLIYPISRGCAVALAAVWTSLFLGHHKNFIGIIGITATCAGILATGLGKRTQTSDQNHARKGVYWALGLGIVISSYFTLDSIIVKHMHPIIYVILMDFIMFFTLMPYMLKTKRKEIHEALTHHKIALTTIGIASNVSYLLILYAFSLGVASYVVALREVSIVFVTLAGLFFLKEKTTKQKMMGIILILIGAILIKSA
jgi:uncharacterized membrane protein